MSGKRAPAVGLVCLGCAKNTVDAQHLAAALLRQGFRLSADYQSAQAVVILTCAFILDAQDESFEAIAEACAQCPCVIVTGCLGAQAELIREVAPDRDLSEYIQPEKSAFGRGGMHSKYTTATKVQQAGIRVIIANGERDDILVDLVEHPSETPHTEFTPPR